MTRCTLQKCRTISLNTQKLREILKSYTILPKDFPTSTRPQLSNSFLNKSSSGNRNKTMPDHS